VAKISSSVANTLGDYEESTWRPVLSDGTNNATSVRVVGNYVKIGNRVFINCDMVITSLGSVTGSIRITGLPAAKGTGTAKGIFAASAANALAITAGYSVGASITGTNQFITLTLWDSTAGDTAMQATEWSADGECSFGGFYIAAD